MTERLTHLNDIDPDDHIFNSIFPNSDITNSCQYYSLQNLNNLKIDSFLNLSLFNCNVRSFNSNGSSYQASFSNLTRTPSFIVLTETWNSPDTYSMCNLSGYTGVHTYRECTRGGGVSVFYDDGLMGDKVDVLSVCNTTIETCVCRVYIEGGYLVIIGIYRPHSDTVLNFTLALETILNSDLIKNACTVLLAGDMNVNISDLKDSHAHNYFSLLHSLNFLPAITRPTRFSTDDLHNSFSNLDHIWINQINPMLSGILCFDISDHCPTFIFFHLNKNVPNNKMRCIKTRPFSDKNLSSLKSELNNMNWDELFNHENGINRNVDEVCETLIANLDTIYCKHFPIKVKYISDKRLGKPWLSPQLKKLINNKSHYFKLYKLGLISKPTNNILKNKVNCSIASKK